MATNAVILCRVSSLQQEDGYSLSAQSARLAEYANRRGMTILREFVITESAAKGSRKKFQEVVKFLKTLKEPAALIADAVDRVQRTFSEIGQIDELRKSGNIDLHFLRENLVISKESSSQDIMRWEFAVLAAHSYVMSLSENVRRSVNHKIRNGEISGHAPIGYLNVRDGAGRPDVVPDPERGPYVRRLFETYAQGGVSLQKLSNMAYEWGLRNRSVNRGAVKLPKSKILYMLNSRFYYGELERGGTIYQLRYQPLISRELWETCQRTLKCYKKQPFKNGYGALPYIYRGLIKDARTGRICTTERHKERLYLTCSNAAGGRQYVPESDITGQIANVLESIKVPMEVLTAAREMLAKEKNVEIGWRESEIKRLQTELRATSQRMDNLLNLYIDGKIDEATYQNKATELRAQQSKTQVAIDGHGAADDKFNETIVNLLQASAGAGEIFYKYANLIESENRSAEEKSSDVRLAQGLLKLIFRTMEIKDGSLCYCLNIPFSEMQNLTQKEQWWR